MDSSGTTIPCDTASAGAKGRYGKQASVSNLLGSLSLSTSSWLKKMSTRYGGVVIVTEGVVLRWRGVVLVLKMGQVPYNLLHEG